MKLEETRKKKSSCPVQDYHNNQYDEINTMASQMISLIGALSFLRNRIESYTNKKLTHDPELNKFILDNVSQKKIKSEITRMCAEILKIERKMHLIRKALDE